MAWRLQAGHSAAEQWQDGALERGGTRGQEQVAAEVEAEEPRGAISGNDADGARSGPRTPQGSTRVVNVVRGWVGLAQQTFTVGTLGHVPVVGGFMSAGRYSRGG